MKFLIGEILIDAGSESEVPNSNAIGIVTGKSDLNRIVDVVPVRVMVLRLCAVGNVAHERPGG